MFISFKKALLLLAGIVIMHTALLAQTGDYRKFSLTAQYGPTFFRGDVPNSTGGIFGIGLRYSPIRAFSIRTGYHTGLLTGSDQIIGGQQFFENSFRKISFEFDFNILAVLQGNHPNKHFYPYALLGVGTMISDLKSVNKNVDPEIGGIEYNGSDFYYSLGMGFKFFISNYFDLFVEGNYHVPNSDLIDGHDPKINESRHTDYFITLSGGIAFKLGNGNKAFADWKNSGNYFKYR